MNLAKIKILAGLKNEAKQLDAAVYREYTQIKTNIIKKALSDFELFFADQGFKIINNNGTKRTVRFFDLEIEIELIESEPTEVDALFKLTVSEPAYSVEIVLLNTAEAFATNLPNNSLDNELEICKQEIGYLTNRLENLSKEEWFYTYPEAGGQQFRSLKSLLVKMFESK